MRPNKGIRQQPSLLIVPDSTSLTVQPAKQTIKLIQFPKKGDYVRLAGATGRVRVGSARSLGGSA
jgi:hypothetical protein